MPHPLSVEVQHELLADLTRLSAEREAAERRVRDEFAARNAAAEKEFRAAKEQLAERFKSQQKSTEREYEELMARASADYQSGQAAASKAYESGRRDVLDDFAKHEQDANKQLAQECWEATTVFESTNPGLLEQYNRVEFKVRGHGETLLVLVDQVWHYLQECRMSGAWSEAPVKGQIDPAGDPFKLLPECIAAAQESQVAKLKRLVAPKFFIDVRPQVISVVLLVASLGLSYAFFGGNVWQWLGIGAGACRS